MDSLALCAFLILRKSFYSLHCFGGYPGVYIWLSWLDWPTYSTVTRPTRAEGQLLWSNK